MMEESHRIDTPVGTLAVQIIGMGQPCVLWHSLFVDERSWERLIPDLSHHRQLVVITGPGHGSSTDPGRRYSNEECAAAARLILDHLHISAPVDWVGNAWGGHVGLVFAAAWPERCRSLVVFGTPIAALSRRERARTHLLLALYRIFGATGLIVHAVTDVLLSADTRGQDQDAVHLVEDCLRRADRRMLCNAVESISLHRIDLTDWVRRVDVPTLVVTGSDHHGFPPEQAEAVARKMPRGTVAVVPGAAYLAPIEAPHASSQLVLAHWADCVDGQPVREQGAHTQPRT